MRILFVCFLVLAVYGFAEANETKSDIITIVALGDSLTEGYQLPREKAYPAQLERLLKAEGYSVEVINHGIAGDTTAGGRSRIGHTLAQEPDLVIVELGPNDFLRGIPPQATKQNLDAILEALTQEGIKVILVGFHAAPNIAPAYKQQFDAIFPTLADAYNIPVFYGFLEGVAGKPKLNLDDALHPNALGYKQVAQNLLPVVLEELEQLQNTHHTLRQ